MRNMDLNVCLPHWFWELALNWTRKAYPFGHHVLTHFGSSCSQVLFSFASCCLYLYGVLLFTDITLTGVNFHSQIYLTVRVWLVDISVN
jgi:hypothetical protein